MMDKTIWSIKTPKNLNLVWHPEETEQTKRWQLISNPASRETKQTKKEKNSWKGISYTNKDSEAQTVWVKLYITQQDHPT